MAKQVKVTPAQQTAARYAVSRSRRSGRSLPDAVARIAQASVSSAAAVARPAARAS